MIVELHAGQIANYRWSSHLTRFGRLAILENKSFAKILAACSAGFAPWSDDVEFRSIVAMIHEIAHYLQDVTTGDALANLVLTPALLCWCWARQREQHPDPLEIVLWLIGFAVSLHYSFSLIHSNYAPVAFYAPVPSLTWAACRFGLIGASSSLSLLRCFPWLELPGRRDFSPAALRRKTFRF